MGSTEQMKTIECEDEAASMIAMQLATSIAVPMVLKAAIELDLLEIIAKAGTAAYLTTTQLAAQLPASNPEASVMLDRMLRLLVSYSVLDCKLVEQPNGHVERLYGLMPVSKFFVKNEDGVSMAPMLFLNQDKVLMKPWYSLKDAVLDGGIAFENVYGMNVFDYMGTNPRLNEVFNQSMAGHSSLSMKKILDVYNGFEGLTSLVDAGGGTGVILNTIISKYPTITGINFDLPHVIEHAPPYAGVEHVGGDMFVSVPRGDAIFMKFITHNWSDEMCLKLLKNCYEAIPENGKVIIADYILPEVIGTELASKIVMHLDVIMLTQITPGGKERTANELEALAKLAGFNSFNKVCCAFNLWVVEISK